jgi:hypothetical protein|tara:strand:+ start:252 stop:425 length:174 start_codon:yes stop_codon:yes gene_type:complete
MCDWGLLTYSDLDLSLIFILLYITKVKPNPENSGNVGSSVLIKKVKVPAIKPIIKTR